MAFRNRLERFEIIYFDTYPTIYLSINRLIKIALHITDIFMTFRWIFGRKSRKKGRKRKWCSTTTIGNKKEIHIIVALMDWNIITVFARLLYEQTVSVREDEDSNYESDCILHRLFLWFCYYYYSALEAKKWLHSSCRNRIEMLLSIQIVGVIRD